MSTLDRVIQMQQQGLSETQISTQLRNEGISPTEINNSLNQAKIKSAVSGPEQGMSQGMQASIMPIPGSESQAPRGVPQMQTQAQPQMQYQSPPPEIYPPQDQYGADAYGQQDYYQEQSQDDYYTQSPQAYSQDYYAPQAGGMDTETISEIAEQVATEKLNEFKKKTGDIVSFKNNIQDKVNDIDDRLKRIETTIDRLQQAIIGKIGEFGESNAMIHRDLENLHGTVSNLMNPLIDNINELRKISN